MFSLFNFSSIFPGGQLAPFAPMCGRPWATWPLLLLLLLLLVTRDADEVTDARDAYFTADNSI